MTAPTNREADQWCKVQHMAAARKAQAARLALVMAKMKPRQGPAPVGLTTPKQGA